MKQIRFGVLFIVLFIQLASCVKESRVTSTNTASESNLITDQKSAQVVLNGVYSKFANISLDPTGGLNHEYTKWYALHELPGSLMNGLITYPSYLENPFEFDNSIAPILTTSLITSMWTNSYDVINASNTFIARINNLPDDKFITKSKKEMLGEVKCLRAYANYQLLTFFSQFYDVKSTYGVMLRKDEININNISLKRSSVADSYVYILEDIDYAIVNAPQNNPNYYVNQWVAKSLKSRILINRGDHDDYAQTIKLTEDIIDNGPYRLETNLKDLFYTKGLSSKEVILGIIPQDKQNEKTGEYKTVFTKVPLYNLLLGDPRQKWRTDDTGEVHKYAGQQGEVSYVFRLSEMYLLEAEAISRNNGDLNKAKTLLKTVMEHAGITDFSEVNDAETTGALVPLIYKEITKNLFCEDGADWFALLRMDFDQVKIERPFIKSKIQYILPIPADEMAKNKDMVQNPGH